MPIPGVPAPKRVDKHKDNGDGGMPVPGSPVVTADGNNDGGSYW
jgi:hypothetical protein